MKYNSNNKPLVCMQTNSTCYKGTTTLNKIKGVLWHSTGANNPTLKRYVQPSSNDPNYNKLINLLGKNTNNNDWNHITRYAGMNAWIGKLADGTVTSVQTMPWNYKPWGCGTGIKGSCNDGWLQFEICEADLNDSDYFSKIYKEACELTAYLCTIHNLDPLGTANHKGVEVPVILCHQDSCKLGLGSNHADVLHWFPKHGKNMDTVRRDVAALMKTTSNSTQKPKVEMYRVRSSWNNIPSQKGAYSNLQNAINACNSAGEGYHVFDSEGKTVYSYTNNKVIEKKGLQAKDLDNLKQEQVIEKVGPLFTKDQEKTGVLACVSLAQFLLESAYGQSELAKNANNCFGMKKMLSGNNWEGSVWNGKVYTKQTQEYENNEYKTITAEFREYENIEDSIADHSAYLLGAKNGNNLRYKNLKNEQNYKTAAQIIKDGGYATSPTYVSNLCNLIEKQNLTKYNAKVEVKEEIKTSKFSNGDVVRLKPGSNYTNGKSIPTWVINSKLYVRGIDGNNIIFSTLKSGDITGVTKEDNLISFDDPNSDNEKDVNYLIKITANLLNVRSGPGVNYPITTTVKHNYKFHIKAENNGWGQLDSGSGWINLKYTERVAEENEK